MIQSIKTQGAPLASRWEPGTGSRRTKLARTWFWPGSLKTWWLFVAFVSGLALAIITEDLILEHRNNRLEFSAPRTDFFAGQPSARLRNALEVPFLIKTTLWSGNKTHVFSSAVDQFVVSFDIFEETYSVVKVQAPRKSKAHLTAKEAQKWCINEMSLDTTGLSGTEPLWARLEILPQDPPRDGSLLGDSVSGSGISLGALVEFFGRSPGSKPIMLEYPQFTLDQLKHTRAF
jgi:hypothetical protein